MRTQIYLKGGIEGTKEGGGDVEMIIFGNSCLLMFEKRINIKIKQLYTLANAVLVSKILICLFMNERQFSDESLNKIYIYESRLGPIVILNNVVEDVFQ